MTPDLKGILLCLYDPTSPESVATAWVIKHACQRDQISLQLQEQVATKALQPDFFDRLTLVAGIAWPAAVIDMIARHATDVVLFPALAGFESYDALRTAPPYRDWVRDGYTVKEIGSVFAQHVGLASVTREAHHAPPQINAWKYFGDSPVPSFLTQPTSLSFEHYDEAYRREMAATTTPSESEAVLLR